MFLFKEDTAGKERTALSTRSTSRLVSHRPKSYRQRSDKHPSIPTKNVATIVDTPRPKAFGQSTIRFEYKKQREDCQVPGPADYSTYRETLWKENRASSSRKGFGYLVSGAFRVNKIANFYNTGPGPASYFPKEKKGMMKSDSTLNIKSIQLLKINNLESHRGQKPRLAESSAHIGPGYYNFDSYRDHHPCNQAAVVFKSKTTRENPLTARPKNDEVPDSWNYDISRDIVKQKTCSIKGTSSFIPTTQIKDYRSNDYSAIKAMVTSPLKTYGKLTDTLAKPTPGPLDYKSQQAFLNNKDRRDFATGKRHPGSGMEGRKTFSVNPNPGPGTYTQNTVFSSLKFKAFDAAFMSTTQRM